MIKPLQIGSLTFPNNLIQGPLAGISCAPFRVLTTSWSQPAFTCTEMISAKTLIRDKINIAKRYWTVAANEGPVCFQLSGNNPVELAEAVKRATEFGASLIDLNCGCPVKKIRAKGAGSKLLSSPMQLYQLIRAMKQSTHLPIGVKIRVQGKYDPVMNQAIAQVVADAEADFLVVHGRHWSEHYETPCRMEEIQYFVNELKIPVIGNGDVACLESLKTMFNTGCAAAMISRAGVGRPWLIAKLKAEAKGESYASPADAIQGQLCIEHLRLLVSLLENDKKAIYEMRTIAKYYARTLKTKTQFCNDINLCDNLPEFMAICQHHFGVHD